MKDALKCYVSGQRSGRDCKQGVISFAVPEYGVLFRCGVSGTLTELHFVAFLTLLRFMELNRDLFVRREVLIFTDFPLLVYLMNEPVAPGKGMEAVKRQAAKYAREFVYRVKWISLKDNRAAGSAADIPVMPAGTKIIIKNILDLKGHEVSGPPESEFKL